MNTHARSPWALWTNPRSLAQHPPTHGKELINNNNNNNNILKTHPMGLFLFVCLFFMHKNA